MPDDERFAAYEAIQRFLSVAKKPVAFEAGEEPMPLTAGLYDIRVDGSRLLFQIWDTKRNLVRRVVGVESESASQLDVTVERFGKRNGTLHMLDASRAAAEMKTRRAGRQAFREQFRRHLLRQYPGWRVAELSCEPDLEHSLSPAHSRALLRKGNTALAAIGAATTSDADFALTFGIIWLDYLRVREARMMIEGLVIVVPDGHERSTCQRLRWLDASAASWTVFVHAEGWERKVELSDAGNIETSLPDRGTRIWVPEWVSRLGAIAGAEIIESGGEISLRVRGLEFARWNGRELRFGVEGRELVTESRRGEAEALAMEIARHRDSGGDRRSKLFSAAPERWLETQIRENLPAVDASLLPSPVYGQAPSFASGQRGVVDLLGAGHDGRLAILEIKASEDIHLPLQALDYWARVKWHLDRGEFTAKNYFPGIHLSPKAPRLLLIAPALHFHPATETIIRYFSSEVQVERIGVSATWRSGLKVMFRACGSAPVQCDDREEEHDEGSTGADAGSGRSGASQSFGSQRGGASSVHDSTGSGDPAGLPGARGMAGAAGTD